MYSRKNVNKFNHKGRKAYKDHKERICHSRESGNLLKLL
jgi:hypothetical protein